MFQQEFDKDIVEAGGKRRKQGALHSRWYLEKEGCWVNLGKKWMGVAFHSTLRSYYMCL